MSKTKASRSTQAKPHTPPPKEHCGAALGISSAQDQSTGGLELPHAWQWLTVGEMTADMQYGSSAKTSEDDTGVPVLRMGNIKEGALVLDSLKYLPKDHPEFPDLLLRDGDLLFNRTNSAELVGKSAVYRGNPEVCSCASYLIRVQLKPAFVPEFVAYYLNSPFGHEWVASVVSQQVGQANVNGTKLKALSVPVPPLKDQRRIVAEIEKQFTRLEAGVAALKRAKANLKRYRAAVLKAACEGKLVPTEAELARSRSGVPPLESRKKRQDAASTFESGEQLLARILTERRQNWQGRGKYVEPEPADNEGLPVLPTGWTWSSLDQLLGFMRNGISVKPDAEAGLPILRISAVRALSVNLAEVRFLNSAVSDYSDYELTEGDLLFTRYNGNPELVGVCGVVPPLTSPFVHPDKLIRCKLVPTGAHPDFVAIMANVGASRNYLAKRVRTTAGQAGISGGDLKGLPIPLAPLAEQTRIVAEVERRLSVVEELEAVVTANLQRATRLRQSILQKAFSGELMTAEVLPSTPVLTLLPKGAGHNPPNQHFARALLSAEIVHRLYNEPTFGRIKHQKIFHLCEHIARIDEIQGQYHREAAGPLDSKLIYTNEKELKKQKWYAEYHRESYGHAYEPLANAGAHRKYLERYWPDQLSVVEQLIELMRTWKTERCEIFCTAYAAWNDLLIQGLEPTEEAILHEVMNCWNDSKKRIPADRWRKAIGWMREKGYAPTGFGKATLSIAAKNKPAGKGKR